MNRGVLLLLLILLLLAGAGGVMPRTDERAAAFRGPARDDVDVDGDTVEPLKEVVEPVRSVPSV